MPHASARSTSDCRTSIPVWFSPHNAAPVEGNVRWSLPAIFLLFTFCFITAAQRASATGLAIVKKNDTIAIGVDSRAVLIPTRAVLSDKICKVGRLGSYFWAAAGLASDGKPGGYSVWDRVAHAAVGANSLAQLVTQFDDIALASLTSFLETDRERIPSEVLSGQVPMLYIVFLGREGGHLEWHLHTFKCARGSTECTIKVTRDDCPGDGCGSNPNFTKWIGPAQVRQYFLSQRDFLSSQPPASAARILVGQMMQYAPDLIGGNIEVVEFTPSGGTWVDDPLGCATSKDGNYPKPKVATVPPTLQRLAVGTRPLPQIDFAALQVNSAPPDATVYFDGSLAGRTPKRIVTNTGEHTIKVTKDGYKPWQTTIKLISDVTVSAELKRE